MYMNITQYTASVYTESLIHADTDSIEVFWESEFQKHVKGRAHYRYIP